MQVQLIKKENEFQVLDTVIKLLLKGMPTENIQPNHRNCNKNQRVIKKNLREKQYKKIDNQKEWNNWNKYPKGE